MDWSLFFAATTASSAFATAISTTLVLILRRRDRPEPDWIVSGETHAGHVDEEHPESAWIGAARDSIRPGDPGGLIVSLTNVGDGTGYYVTLDADNCYLRVVSSKGRESRSFYQHLVWFHEAVVGPGETIRLQGHLTAALTDAAISVTWTAPPTRLKRRKSQRVELSPGLTEIRHR